MPNNVLERLVVEIVGDVQQLKTSLSEAEKLTQQFSRSAKVSLSGGSQASQSAKELLTDWDRLRKASLDLRNAREAEIITDKQLVAAEKAVQEAAIKGAQSITEEARATKEGAAAYSQYLRAAGTASRTIATVEGRVTHLGLSANVATALTQSLGMQMYRFGPAGMVMANGITGASGALATMGVAATAGVAGVAALGAASYALVRRGIPQVKEMQQALQLLIATGNSMSMNELASGIDKAAQAAGLAGTQFSRGELATGLARLVKAGLSAADAFKLLAPSMQLAVESGQSFEQASTLLLTNLRQFSLPIDQASEAAKALGVASLRARDNAQGLSEGLAVVGPIAQQAGLTMAQTTAALVTLSNKGLDAADIGARGLRTTITHLINPSKEASKALEAMGVSVKTAAGHQRSFDQILGDVITAANKYGISIDQATGKVVGQHDAIALLAQIVGQRGLAAVAGMASAASDATNSWQANTKAITDSTESLQHYADTLLKNNLVASQKHLQTSLDNLGSTLTTKLAPGMVDATNATADFLDALNNMASFDFTGLTQKLGSFAENVAKAMDKSGLFGYNPGGLARLVELERRLLGQNPSNDQGTGTNQNGGIGDNPYGPTRPGESNNGPFGNGNAGDNANVLTYASSELIQKATELVKTLNAARAGTSVTGLLKAQDAVTAFESVGGSDEQALRRSIVSAVSTIVGNATKAAAKDIVAQRGIYAPLTSEEQQLVQAMVGAPSTAVMERSQYGLAQLQSSYQASGSNLMGWLGFTLDKSILSSLAQATSSADTAVQPGVRKMSGWLAGQLTGIVGHAASAAAEEAKAQQNAAIRDQMASDRGLAYIQGSFSATGSMFAGAYPGTVGNSILSSLSQATASADSGVRPSVTRGAQWVADSLTGFVTHTAQAGVEQAIANGTVGPAYWDAQTNFADMIRGGTVLPRTGTAGYGTALPGQMPTTGSFTDTLNALEGAGREIYANQRKAGQEQQKSAQQFAQTVVSAGGSFAQAIISGSPGGIVSSGLGAAGSILGSIGGDIIDGLSFGLAGTIVSTVGSILGGLIGAGGAGARPAPVGAAFGATRPNIGNPDIALTVGTSQASLGPAISSKILDAGNLFDQAASRFDGAVDKIIAGVSSKIQKPSYATSANL